MKIGKVPFDLLHRLLGQVQVTDPRVLLGPCIGEDAALIDYGDKVLVAKTDPITFATDLIGWYAVQVNANDIACAGATPRWFLASLLLPTSITEDGIAAIFTQLTDACAALDVSLVGGHTEITQGLTQPIVVGCMLGEVVKGKTVVTSGAQVGDSVVITKGIAVEGSALLARERPQELLDLGIPPQTVESAAQMLFSPGISVVNDARIACAAVEVHSLHDPTEGGLATGLRELARAAGAGMEIDGDAIPVLPQCQAICDALGLDPLGLLASGCLVATVSRRDAPLLISALEKEGVKAFEIGEVTDVEAGVVLRDAHGRQPLPTYERDELARYLDA